MSTGKRVFTHVMDHRPRPRFHRRIDPYKGNHTGKSFACRPPYRCMALAPRTDRSSLPRLRAIAMGLRAQTDKLYPMGLRGGVARNTRSNANTVRDGRLCAAFTQHRIPTARPLYRAPAHDLERPGTTWISIRPLTRLIPPPSTCASPSFRALSMVRFRKTKRLSRCTHVLTGAALSPLSFLLQQGARPDVNILDILDILAPELGAQSGAPSLSWTAPLSISRAFTRCPQCAPQYRPLCAPGKKEHEAKTSLFASRQALVTARPESSVTRLSDRRTSPHPRTIPTHGAVSRITTVQRKERVCFSPMIMFGRHIPLRTCSARGPVAPCFKWIQQNRRIKAFSGTSENAVRSQIWIAVSVYVLVALLRNRLTLDMRLHRIRQILSVTPFETMSFNQLLSTQRHPKPKLEPDK